MGAIVGHIGAGRSIEEVLADYPYLEREDVMQALRYAAWLADSLHAWPTLTSNDTPQIEDDIFGFMKGKGEVEILGDIVSPAFTLEEWGETYPCPRPRRSRRKKISRSR